jgi:hypothetical protein
LVHKAKLRVKPKYPDRLKSVIAFDYLDEEMVDIIIRRDGVVGIKEQFRENKPNKQRGYVGTSPIDRSVINLVGKIGKAVVGGG